MNNGVQCALLAGVIFAPRRKIEQEIWVGNGEGNVRVWVWDSGES